MLLKEIIKSKISSGYNNIDEEKILCSIMKIFAISLLIGLTMFLITAGIVQSTKQEHKIKNNLTEVSKQYKENQKSKEEKE